MKNSKNKLIVFLMFMFLSFNVCYSAATGIDAQIAKIENSIWGFEYSKEDASKRLLRIENNVFGTTSPKLTIEQRIKKLNEAMGLESFEESQVTTMEEDSREIAGINYPQIDILEYQMFHTTYKKENIYKRLDRLEKKIFGSTQDGNLAVRTDRLKVYIQKDAIAKNQGYHIQKPYSTTSEVEQFIGSQDKYENSDIYIQLAGLETALFSKTYSQDPVGLRLNRLERKIFQRDFASDDEYMRIQRLQAAANAQQTARLYEANKIQKYTSTGVQIGSILLMILALIL